MEAPVEIRIKTVQIAQWRKVQGPDVFMDITVKSGFKPFAPTWDMLMAFRADEMSEEHYQVRYVELLIERILNNLPYYRQLLIDAQNDGGAIVMACYCKAGDFCHRYIFVEDVIPKIARPLNLTFKYLGEVT